jgi:hypothetical protein
VVTRWHPHFDLVHLIEALSEEILAATDEEVRASGGYRRTTGSAAREVKLLIERACAEVDEDLGRNLNEGRARDLNDDLIEPGTGPRPAGVPRRPPHFQRH